MYFLIIINLVNSKDDRRRIIQLLQFAEPIEKSKVIFYDRRPETSKLPPKSLAESFPNTILGASGKNLKSTSLKKYSTYRKKNNNNKKKAYNDFIRTNRKPPIEARITKVKTIMFPNDEKEFHYNEENKCLMKQKEELKELYENMLIKLNEQDKLRDEEIRLHTINMNSNIEKMNKKNQLLKNNNYNLTKKYMDLKYDTNQNNQKLNDEIEMKKLQGEALKGSINELIKKNRIDKEISKKDFDRRTRQLASTLRTQVKTKEETANIVMRQFNDIQKMYEDKMNETKNKYKLYENKYLLLKEGYFNEEEYRKKISEVEENIRLFRVKMREFEAYINEIKQLTEGDYDHYLEIQKKTQAKNQQFLEETRNIDEQLIAFELILQERHNENMQMLKEIKEHFDENGAMFNQDKNQRFLEDSQNKIIEEEEEKMQEVS
jgi:hypothetical protein